MCENEEIRIESKIMSRMRAQERSVSQRGAGCHVVRLETNNVLLREVPHVLRHKARRR